MAKQQLPSDSAHDSAANAAEPARLAALRSRLPARLPRLSRRIVIGLALTLLLLAINGAVLWNWLPKLAESQAETHATLPRALAALDHHSLNEAKFLAGALQHSPRLSPADRGGPPFVLGAAIAEEAELLPETDRREAYRTAAQYLEEARQRGFPEGRQVEGLFLLGKSLYYSGDLVASRTVLEEAFHTDQQLNADAFQILAADYFHSSQPDDHKACEFIEHYLSAPSLTASQRDWARLLEARILDRLGDVAGCEKSLALILETAACHAAALEFEAELLMRQAQAPSNESSGKQYQQAIEKFRSAEHDRSASSTLGLRCMYLIGVCQQDSGQLQAALEQFQLVRNENVHSDEGVAATFRIAQLLRRQGREDDAIAAYRQVVQAMGDSANYHNKFLAVDEVRQELLSVYQQYLNAAKFDSAAQLARLLHPLFPQERDLELRGEMLRSAANSYRDKAIGSPSDQAKLLNAKARVNLRQAGQAFARLSELHAASRSYTDDLWNAAQCYFEGQDYQHATRVLDLYLKNEVRRRRATALLLLGESQLSLGQTEKGLSALNECVDTNAADPASYRARYLLAKAYQEAGDDTKAEGLLRSNLEGGNLTPRSVEWRDSLFALASLMEMAGHYQEAIPRLEEAVARYPDATQAMEARYLTAESYRRLAREARQKMADDTTQSVRAMHAKQMQDDLSNALAQFEQLQSLLTHDRARDPSPLEKAILRNCYFGRGATLYNLRRYEEAIRVYLTAANAYRNEPEMLEALTQVAACYRELNQPVEARGTIAQAKAALARIDKKANFTLTTNYTREEWGRVLDQFATL